MAIRLNVNFLIPLKYNDGTDVEQEKLFEIREKIVKLFDAVTIHPLSTKGIWISDKSKKRYYDICKRFEVSIEKSRSYDKILKDLKEYLKRKFKQEEIYMYYTEVNLV